MLAVREVLELRVNEQQLGAGAAFLSRGQEQAPPAHSSGERQSQCWQDLCRTGQVHERGETGADTDFALTNRGESLAGLVKC